MKSFQGILEKKIRAYQGSQARACDEKTLVFLFQKVLKQEYGAQGLHALVEATYKEETLLIRVSKSLWETELNVQKKFLVEELNKLAGQACVKKIVVKRG